MFLKFHGTQLGEEEKGGENTSKSKHIKKNQFDLIFENLESIDIHVFGDASLLETCAVEYAVIQSGIKAVI